jgi:ABC-type sugar transport system permease subunit
VHFFNYKEKAGVMFITPATLVLGIFLGIPVIVAVFASFTNTDMLTPTKWIGLSNYTNILQSPEFFNSLGITVKVILGASIPILVTGLLLAVLLKERFFGSQLFKLIIFVPVVLSESITSLVWEMFLHKDGLFNGILTGIGLMDSPVKWFHTPGFALAGLILFVIWAEVGYFMIIFLAGLQNIPNDCYEAARIDGANAFTQFFHITLPLLKPTILFATIIVLIRTLNVFTPFFVITRGGPFNSTETLPLLIYDTAFLFTQIGKASALSMIVLLIVSIFSGLLFRIERQK